MTEMSRVAELNVVATYASPEEARAALTVLERKGVEAADIELFGPGMDAATRPITNDEQRGADMNAVGAVGRRVGVTTVATVVVGALVGALVGFLIARTGVGVLAGAVSGAVIGAVFGLLYGGYSGLPVSEEWGETFESDGGETSVAVHADDRSEFERALDALRPTRARRLATCGRDGQLRDVA